MENLNNKEMTADTLREMYKQALEEKKNFPVQLMNNIYTGINTRIRENIIDKKLIVSLSDILLWLSCCEDRLKGSLTIKQIVDKCISHYKSIGLTVVCKYDDDNTYYLSFTLTWDHLVDDLDE